MTKENSMANESERQATEAVLAVARHEQRTAFIVPGDIMRGLVAQLRHRGFDVENAEAYEMPETGMIVAAALAAEGRYGKVGHVVCVYGRQTNDARVLSTTFGLDFTFEGEES
jgi:hypothetical protein